MIDQVAIRRSVGFDLLTVADWLDLETAEKKRLLLGQRVEFLADGDEVPVRDALLELKNLAIPA